MPKLYKLIISYIIWDKVFKNEPSKICGREPLKSFTWSTLEYFVSMTATRMEAGRVKLAWGQNRLKLWTDVAA